MKIVKQSLIFSSGFAGGILTAFFISSLKNPDAYKNQIHRGEKLIARFNQFTKESSERLRDMNERLRKEFAHPVPDLYRATESLSLDEEELIYD